MMKGFAKIIELEEYDVLIKRGSDDENGEHIDMITVIEGAEATQKLILGDNEEKAIEVFDALGVDSAKQYVDNLLEMMD